MKLVYIGPHPTVDVIYAGDVLAEDVRSGGEPFEVEDPAIAAGLLSQETFKKAPAAAAAAKPSSTGA